MKIKEDQPLQTKFQSLLMKIHGVVEKVENFFLSPIRKLMDSNTQVFVEKPKPSLKDLSKLD